MHDTSALQFPHCSPCIAAPALVSLSMTLVAADPVAEPVCEAAARLQCQLGTCGTLPGGLFIPMCIRACCCCLACVCRTNAAGRVLVLCRVCVLFFLCVIRAAGATAAATARLLLCRVSAACYLRVCCASMCRSLRLWLCVFRPVELTSCIVCITVVFGVCYARVMYALRRGVSGIPVCA